MMLDQICSSGATARSGMAQSDIHAPSSQPGIPRARDGHAGTPLRLLPSGHPRTRPGPPAPRLGACTTAVRYEDLLFPNEPAAGAAEDRRTTADIRPPTAHRAR